MKKIKDWLPVLILATTLLLLLPPQAFAGTELDEARAAVEQSTRTAVETLDRVYNEEVPDQAREAILRARGEVLKTHERALDNIDRAKKGQIPEGEGLLTAMYATQKHEEVLHTVMMRVPDQARGAIMHAMEVSRHGNARVRALQAGMRGQDLSDRPDVGQRPDLGRPREYGPSRDVGRPPAPGAPGSGFRPGR